MGPKGKLKALNAAARKQCGMKPDANDSTGIELRALAAYSSDYDYADKIVNLRHTGWYTDEHGDGFKMRGQVWQVASDNGISDGRYPVFYIAGYLEENGCYACLDVTRGAISVFDNARDAAMRADELARIHAEHESEHNEKWQEASRLSDDIESLKTFCHKYRKDWKANMAAMRAASDLTSPRVAPATYQAMADSARTCHAESIAEIVSKRERITELGMAGEF